MQLDVATASILSAAVATIVGGGITALNLWLARRSDERRQIRELAVRVALENWKIYKESAENAGAKSAPPIDGFLVHAAHLVSALDGSLATNEQIVAHLRRTYAAADAAAGEIKKRENQERKPKPAA